MHHVRLLLDVAVVLCLCTLVLQALLVRVKHDVTVGDAPRNVAFLDKIHRLWQVGDVADALALTQPSCQFQRHLFAHAVGNHVGAAVHEDARTQTILPVVIVGETSQGSFYASEHHGHVGVELFENLRVDDGGIFRSFVVASVGRVGILRAQPSCGGVLVHHRIHAPWRNAEEQPRSPQLREVAVVAVPIGLRYDGHMITRSFQYATDDSHTKRRVVNVCVTREENNVHVVPTTQLHLLLCRRQKVGQPIIINCQFSILNCQLSIVN